MTVSVEAPPVQQAAATAQVTAFRSVECPLWYGACKKELVFRRGTLPRSPAPKPDAPDPGMHQHDDLTVRRAFDPPTRGDGIMTFRLFPALILGLMALPAVSHAADRSLHRAAERYEDAVEDLYGAVRKARSDDYIVRLVKSLERLADDFEEATEDRQDPYAVRHRFHELLSTHNRVNELLAQPYAIQGERLANAVRDVDLAWHDLTAFFVGGPHPSPHHQQGPYHEQAPHQAHGPYYGRYAAPTYEPLPPAPPVRQPPYYGYRVSPGFYFEFGGRNDYGWQGPPVAYGRDFRHDGHHGPGVHRHLDDDDYEDYVEDLEERAEEARERREDQLEEWRERREEALEEQRERYEDYFDDDRRPGRLRRLLDRL